MIEFVERDGEYHAPVRLQSWSGFRDASGPYGSPIRPLSDGSTAFRLIRTPDSSDPPTPTERTAAEYVLMHEDEIAKAAIDAIFEDYRAFRSYYVAEYPPDVAARELPDIAQADGLKQLIGLDCIFLHASQPGHDRMQPYFGLAMGCEWDSEHGLGLLMQGTRPVEIAGEETAFDGSGVEVDRFCHKALRALNRRIDSTRLAVKSRSTLRRGWSWLPGFQPDLTVESLTGEPLLAIDMHWSHDRPDFWEWEASDVARFYMFRPLITRALRLHPGRPFATYWTRAPGGSWSLEHSVRHNQMIDVSPLSLRMPLSDFYNP